MNTYGDYENEMNTLRSLYQTNKVVRTILTPFLKPNVQENVDLYRAGLALKCSIFCSKSNAQPTERDVKQFYADIDALDGYSLKNFVENELTSQIRVMFERVHSGAESYDSFSVCSGKSGIEGAGEGVFLKSKNDIPPGTVVALCPGWVHLKEHLSDAAYMRTLLPDPHLLLMCRLDQTIIDSRQMTDDMQLNPYALAHKVNHCGRNKPNVFQVFE